ncbi:hypothetical protein [Nonomuraea sp. NPDC005650]|uniref:hypothetical protein n=1 Tax=Nonomuraea sp. NPDC005650 TaxID=3157045 RepID=UPI0033A6053F
MTTTTFQIGQRVRTTVDIPLDKDSGYSAPAGTLGTITDVHRSGGYGVLLDGDPYKLSASFGADELTAS